MGDLILELLLRDVEILYDGDQILVPCRKKKYDSLFLMIDDTTWVEIPAWTFIIHYPLIGDLYRGKCVLGIGVHDRTYFILGNTFYRSYYIIHDDDNS